MEEKTNVEINFNPLKGRIIERYDTLSNFAKTLGLSKQNLSAKMNNKSDFSRDTVIKICELLDISDCEIGKFFFAPKVNKSNMIQDKNETLKDFANYLLYEFFSNSEGNEKKKDEVKSKNVQKKNDQS